MSAASPRTVRIFLSWAHEDKAAKDKLLDALLPALHLLDNLHVQWWEDSHLTCGEDFLPGILDRLDEADYGLLLLSPRFLTSPFILKHELPRFTGEHPDKGALPVLLRPLPGFGPEWNLHGLNDLQVFTRAGKSFEETTGPRCGVFANELTVAIRKRILGQNGYRSL